MRGSKSSWGEGGEQKRKEELYKYNKSTGKDDLSRREGKKKEEGQRNARSGRGRKKRRKRTKEKERDWSYIMGLSVTSENEGKKVQ